MAPDPEKHLYIDHVGDRTPYRDAFETIQSLFEEGVQKEEKELIERWTKIADNVLIFSSLFSAVTTSFIIESYRSLQPDSNQRLADILITMSGQLAALQNSSIVAPAYVPPDSDQFRPRLIMVWVNGLWLSSLAFSLMTALFGALLHESTRAYNSTLSDYKAPQVRGEVRTYVFPRLRRTWRMPEIVAFIPTFIEITLILFLAGLFLFIWDVYQAIAIGLVSIVGVPTGIYLLISFAPLFTCDFPYRTALSRLVLFLPHFTAFFKLSFHSSSISTRSPSHRPALPQYSSFAERNAEKLKETARRNTDVDLYEAFRFLAPHLDTEGLIEQIAECVPSVLGDSRLPPQSRSKSARLFISCYTPSVGRLLHTLSEKEDTRIRKLLRAVSSALSHTEKRYILSLTEGIPNSGQWLVRCRALFSHRSPNVAQEAMAIYALIINAELGAEGTGSGSGKLPTTEDVMLIRKYLPPTPPSGSTPDAPEISWEMIVDCFNRTDGNQAKYIRGAWPKVYMAFAGLSNSNRGTIDTLSPATKTLTPQQQHTASNAFTKAAAALVNQLTLKSKPRYHGQTGQVELYPELLDDIQKVIRGCFALKHITDSKAQQELVDALNSYRGTLSEEVKREFREYVQTASPQASGDPV